MSSQLPPPQPGRNGATMPNEDDLELPPEPRGLLRTIRQWYYRHPTIIDISIAAGVVTYAFFTGVTFFLRPSSPVKTYPLLPLTLTAIALLGIALALRRRAPVWSWATILLIPEVYQFAILRAFHLTLEQLLYAAIGVSGMGLISLPFALGAVVVFLSQTWTEVLWFNQLGFSRALWYPGAPVSPAIPQLPRELAHLDHERAPLARQHGPRQHAGWYLAPSREGRRRHPASGCEPHAPDQGHVASDVFRDARSALPLSPRSTSASSSPTRLSGTAPARARRVLCLVRCAAPPSLRAPAVRRGVCVGGA